MTVFTKGLLESFKDEVRLIPDLRFNLKFIGNRVRLLSKLQQAVVIFTFSNKLEIDKIDCTINVSNKDGDVERDVRILYKINFPESTRYGKSWISVDVSGDHVILSLEDRVWCKKRFYMNPYDSNRLLIEQIQKGLEFLFDNFSGRK